MRCLLTISPPPGLMHFPLSPSDTPCPMLAFSGCMPEPCQKEKTLFNILRCFYFFSPSLFSSSFSTRGFTLWSDIRHFCLTSPAGPGFLITSQWGWPFDRQWGNFMGSLGDSLTFKSIVLFSGFTLAQLVFLSLSHLPVLSLSQSVFFNQ